MEEKRRHGGWFFKILGGAVVGLLVTAIFSLVIGAIAMVLWNWLMPVIFKLGTIDYWQAFGIVLFAKLVFGGFGKHFMPPFAGRKWDPKRWEEYSKHWDVYRDRMKEYQRHRGPRPNWCMDEDYEGWWEKQGSQSFEEYMKEKNKDSKGTEEK